MISNLVFVAVLSYVMMSAVELDLRPHLLNQSVSNVKLNHPNGFSAINGTKFASLHQEICDARKTGFKDTPALLILGLALMIIFFKELVEFRSEVR